MEFIGFCILAVFCVMVTVGGFIVGARLFAKWVTSGGKSAAAGNFLDQAEHAIEGMAGAVKRLTHGQLLDKAEALVKELTSGGYLTEADGQSIVTKIATGLTTHKAPAAPVTEAVPAA